MDQESQSFQYPSDSENLSQVLNSALGTLKDMDYCVDEISILKGNEKIHFKITKQLPGSPENDFQQACKVLSISDHELPFQALMNQDSNLILPCQILSTDQQKLLKWQPFYYVDEQGNYRCKHCPNHKKFTTSKWLVQHLDKVAKKNAENFSEESSNCEDN